MKTYNQNNNFQIIENQRFDQERALYGSEKLKVINCAFDGPADGESAFKECRDISVDKCFLNLRYPFWHNSYLEIKNSEMTSQCRAALWYTDHADITDTKLHGIKALRECRDIDIDRCDIISPEFGWSVNNLNVKNTTAQGEYFVMRCQNLDFKNFSLNGKYSFQYIKNARFINCDFDTKDAFWHSENVTVENSTVKGEYLAWYSDRLTLINCKIIGTQPFCYCSNLKLISCEMIDCDLAFEKSCVEADIHSHIVSVKNPYRGYIKAESIGEIIIDDEKSVKEACVIETERELSETH